MWGAITNYDIYRGVFKNRKKNGGGYWIEIAIAPKINRKKEIVGYISIAKDITHQIELEATLKRLKEATKKSQIDFLTNIYNRSMIDEGIEEFIERIKETKESLSIGFFDIDHFKDVNDKFGHLEGDEVLVNLSRFVLSKISGNEIFGRWGGEEFVVVYKGSNLEESYTKMEQLRLEVSKANLSGEAKNITISAGVAQFMENEDERSFIHRADEALYKAKQSGRNKVVKATS